MNFSWYPPGVLGSVFLNKLSLTWGTVAKIQIAFTSEKSNSLQVNPILHTYNNRQKAQSYLISDLCALFPTDYRSGVDLCINIIKIYTLSVLIHFTPIHNLLANIQRQSNNTHQNVFSNINCTREKYPADYVNRIINSKNENKYFRMCDYNQKNYK